MLSAAMELEDLNVFRDHGVTVMCLVLAFVRVPALNPKDKLNPNFSSIFVVGMPTYNRENMHNVNENFKFKLSVPCGSY